MKSRRHPSPFALAVLALALPLSLAAQEDPGPAAIRAADLRADIGFLASDELQGRAAGSVYNDIAARYVAQQFERAGLRKVCENGTSWFQPFDVSKGRGRELGETRNVLGLLDGTHPTLKRQVVVVGGHHDHVGLGGFGSRGKSKEDPIHNGADDNASGTAGVLALARAFAASPPRRSMLFMTFSAEELGLIGSREYVRDPAVPLDDTIAMINFDMIGRSEDDYLFVGGVGTSPQWPEMLERHVENSGFEVERGLGGRAPSDSTNFYAQGIPVLFFFTNVHEDYHRSTDHAEFINYEGERRIVRAAYDLIRDLADRDEPIEFTKNDRMDMPKTFMKKLMTPSRALEMGRQLRDQGRGKKNGDK